MFHIEPSETVISTFEPTTSVVSLQSLDCPRTRELRINFQFTVLQKLLVGKLKNYRIVIWHDAINNSLTPHSSNNNNPCTIKELVVFVKGIKKRVTAIVYCRRMFKGKLLPDISERLAKTGIRIIEVKRHLILRRKNSNPVYLDELAELHPTPASQSILLQTSLRHLVKKTADREELQPVRGRRRSKVKRPSQNKRKQAQKKQEKNNKLSCLVVCLLLLFSVPWELAEVCSRVCPLVAKSVRLVPPLTMTPCKTCNKPIGAKDLTYHCVACETRKNLNPTCTGLSNVAINGIKELGVRLALFCDDCVENNRKDHLQNTIQANEKLNCKLESLARTIEKSIDERVSSVVEKREIRIGEVVTKIIEKRLEP